MFNKIKEQGYYLIAEVGVNYYDIAKKKGITVFDAAKLMCDKVSEAKWDAIKFQTYKAENLASKNSPAYWDIKEESTKSQYELFKKFDLFGEYEYKELSKYCESLNIDFLSTPFDFRAVDYLCDIMKYFKISSSDINNIPFIEYISKKNKPILISTGASDFEEIKKAIDIIKQFNNNQVVLMHCILEYPTEKEHANLNKIVSLKDKFPELIIGYSDHTKPDSNYDILKTAYNLGAKVIEKHFTLDKSLKGNDHYHAADFNDAINIKNGLDYINIIRGNYNLQHLESEEVSRKYARRSIVAKKRLHKGDIIQREDIIFKRPGIGISPSEIDNIIGKTIIKDIEEDDIIYFKDLI